MGTTMEKTHTPCPWAITIADRFGGRTDRYIETRGSNSVTAKEPIASVADGPSAEANANLIAAAPDLLAACKSLVELMDSEDEVVVGCHCTNTDTGFGPMRCCWCIAKDAIAKAEGK